MIMGATRNWRHGLRWRCALGLSGAFMLTMWCPKRAILPLNGTREGLFLAAQTAPQKANGLMAMPDPFYQIYAAPPGGAAALSAATQENGFMPALEDISVDVLTRLRALYLCNRPIHKGRWLIRFISKSA